MKLELEEHQRKLQKKNITAGIKDKSSAHMQTTSKRIELESPGSRGFDALSIFLRNNTCHIFSARTSEKQKKRWLDV